MRRVACAALCLASACAAPGPAHPPRPPATTPASSASADVDGWRKQIPKAGPAAAIVYPVPESEQLKNGLTVLVMKRPAAVASLSLVVRHGASSSPQGQSGVAALTARMLTEGTTTRSSSALAEAAESLGSALEHDAGRDYSMVGIETLSADVEQGLALLAEVAQKPAFAPRELERVRGEWLDGLAAERQTPDRLASLAGLRLLLGEPHGAPVGGSVPDVKKLTVRDLTAFHRRHWVPGESALVVVGDVSLSGVRDAAERAFGGWKPAPAPTSAPAPTPAPPDKTRVVMVNRPGAVQSALFVAQPLAKRSDAGHEARQLMSSLLGGLFTSRINQNLREKNAFTYGARSDAVATRHWGALVVTTRVESAVTAPALRELVGELARARDPKRGAPISDEEVARARADLISGLGARLIAVDRLAADVGSSFALGLPPSTSSELPQRLTAQSTAAVAAEAARIDEQRLVVVIVGDQASVKPALEAAGFEVREAAAELTW